MKTNNWPQPNLKRNIAATVDVLMGSSFKDAGEKINVSICRMRQITFATLKNTILKNPDIDWYDDWGYLSIYSLRKHSEYLCGLLNKELDSEN